MNNIYAMLNQKNMMMQFEEFRKTFTGNPQEEVQKLLDSGKMSADQFNRLSQMATQFQSMFGK